MYNYESYEDSAAILREKLHDFKPEILLITGSGLGELAEDLSEPTCVPYVDIPRMRKSTAPGHEGRFAAGSLGGKRVLMMQGRLHMYEGYTDEEVAFPVRLAYLLGARSLIVTNVSGGVNLQYRIGDLVMLTDLIKFAAPDPLIGPNIAEFGPRFPEMTHVFSAEYRTLAQDIARSQSLELKEGVYFYTTGPQFETPAEIRAIRILGGDLAGMSTAPECLAAVHCGMRILGISLVVNMAAGILDMPFSKQEVSEAVFAGKARLSRLITQFVESVTV
jgi:purine-nucleoside phosphorylase